MLEVLAEDYIRTARAKGVATRPVLLKHALKNAGVPIVTVIGIGVALLIGGVVITETRVQHSRRRPPRRRRDLAARLPDHPGRDPDLLGRLRDREPAGRPQLHRCSIRGSATDGDAAVTEPALAPRRPRRRAASGASCGAIRRWSSAASILGLIALRRRSPRRSIAGDRASRCSRRSGCSRPRRRIWFGTDNLGRDVYRPHHLRRARLARRRPVGRGDRRSSIGLVDRPARRLSSAGRRRRHAADGRADGDPGDPARDRARGADRGRASATVIVAITIPEVPRVVRLVRSVVLIGARGSPTSRPRSPAARGVRRSSCATSCRRRCRR